MSHHPSVPASMLSKASRTTQDTVNQEDNPESPGQPQNSHTTHTKKRKCTLKPIPTFQKPDKQWVNTRNLSATLLTGGNQSPRTQTPSAQAVQSHPSAHPKCPHRYHRICLYKHPQPSTPARRPE